MKHTEIRNNDPIPLVFNAQTLAGLLNKTVEEMRQQYALLIDTVFNYEAPEQTSDTGPERNGNICIKCVTWIDEGGHCSGCKSYHP